LQYIFKVFQGFLPLKNHLNDKAGKFVDKFGIFNLLKGLLNQENSQNSNAPGGVLDGILNSIATPKEEQPKLEPKKNSVPPLQSQMLGTMKSHDEFIKRVNKNSKNY
jgi:hypothetical protein